ncbi:MAG: hypothetical protein HS132_06490 [Planctomycetia bacterium]|nr:hypothetical protein [Planctomycetia bacterium]
MSFWEFPRYVPVGEKQQRSKKKLEQLMKKNKDIKPVIIEGRTLAKTWWGKAWNKNLESYADYSNRIGRGRSYVRCGSVLDLQICEGNIQSLVQGSGSDPYSIKIKIKPLEKTMWEEIKDFCAGKLDSLQELLMGKFPAALDEIFTARGKGLFPSPKEIDFDCSCPDWASMCKHVAATLYGIGARLDHEPNLFFLLRKIEIGDLISETMRDKTEELLTRAKRKSLRIIEDQDLSSVFGIELDSASGFEKKIDVKVANTSTAQKEGKTAAKTGRKPAKKTAHEAETMAAKKAVRKTTKKTKKGATKKTTKGKATKKPAKKPAKKTKITPEDVDKK